MTNIEQYGINKIDQILIKWSSWVLKAVGVQELELRILHTD